MSGSSFIILNGELIEITNAKISPVNRGLFYGDGCFETLKSYSGKFLEWDAHFQRLSSALTYLEIDLPFLSEDLKKQVLILLRKNQFSDKEALVRIQSWREGERGYNSDSNSANWMIQASEISSGKEPITLAIAQTRCIPSAALDRAYKLSNGLNYIKAAQEAEARQADDALMLTINNKISETTSANIFWLRNGTIFTPSVKCDLLPGITRNLIIRVIQNLDIDFREGEFDLSEVMKAEAVFCTNSIIEIQEVALIEGTKFKRGHPKFIQVKKEFEKLKDLQLKDEPI